MGKNENEHAGNDNWGTPAAVLEPIYEHLGPIGLDPFGHPESPVTADRYFMLNKYLGDSWFVGQTHYGKLGIGDEDELLAKNWDGHGLVFANGPFSDVAPWAYKGATQGDEVILLVPVRTGSNWWQRHIAPADVVLFWKGRLKFVGAKDQAPFHCALIYWGERREKFLEAFPGHWYVTNN